MSTDRENQQVAIALTTAMLHGDTRTAAAVVQEYADHPEAALRLIGAQASFSALLVRLMPVAMAWAAEHFSGLPLTEDAAALTPEDAAPLLQVIAQLAAEHGEDG